MKDFKELDKRSVHEVEESILNEWKKQDILNKCIDSKKTGYFMMVRFMQMLSQEFIMF